MSSEKNLFLNNNNIVTQAVHQDEEKSCVCLYKTHTCSNNTRSCWISWRRWASILSGLWKGSSSAECLTRNNSSFNVSSHLKGSRRRNLREEGVLILDIYNTTAWDIQAVLLLLFAAHLRSSQTKMMVRSGPSGGGLLNFLSVVVVLLTESFTSKYPRLLSLRMKVGLQNKKGPFVVKVYILQWNSRARARTYQDVFLTTGEKIWAIVFHGYYAQYIIFGWLNRSQKGLHKVIFLLSSFYNGFIQSNRFFLEITWLWLDDKVNKMVIFVVDCNLWNFTCKFD